jgi:hypothetical protein
MVKYMPRTGDVSAGILFPASLRQKMGKDVPPAGQLIGASASVSTGTLIGADVKLVLASAKAAGSLAQLLQQMVKTAASDRSVQQMGLDKALSKTQVSSAGATVRIRGKLPTDKLMAILGQLL